MPEFLLDRRRAVLVGAVALLALVLGGRTFFRAKTAAIPPPVLVAAPARQHAQARAELFVHVVGAVRRPGLYRLRDGSRVADAVRRAGGPTRRAQLELLNLAARVADGEQVLVPRRGVPLPAVAGGASAPSGPVHLNTATLEQLDELPGIGPVTAQKILDYRQAHGPFGAVDELDAVPGIGPARMAELRERVAP